MVLSMSDDIMRKVFLLTFSTEKVSGGKGNLLVRSRVTAIPHFAAMFATSYKMLQPQLTRAEPTDKASLCVCSPTASQGIPKRD